MTNDRSDFSKKDKVRRSAMQHLISTNQPERCGRCNGGPGDPGCGKIIHLILDQEFMNAAQIMGLPEEEAAELMREEE